MEGLLRSAKPTPRQELHDRMKPIKVANVRVIDGSLETIVLPKDDSINFVLIYLDYHERVSDVRAALKRRISHP